MEKGHKMPNDGAALKGKLAEFGMDFVGGWYSTELLKRSAREEFEAAKAHIAMTKGAGANIVIVAETSNAIHGDRSKPLSERPRLAKGDWARLRRQDDRIRRASCRRGAQALLSSSHGHDRPVGARHRRSHGAHQAAGASSARHRPRALGRLGSGGARARLSRRASATSTARTCARRRCAKRTPATGASSIRS